jgi:uncharacterized protein YjbI with pentapeptide repeats
MKAGTDSFLIRFWKRLTDRSKVPRRWWYPLPSSGFRHKTIVAESHQKCSETITKTMLMLLGVALFCSLTALGSPDKLLIAADSTVKVPFADAPISFIGFILVGPVLLFVITVYLHIFYGYWLEFERKRRFINQTLIDTEDQQLGSTPSIFSFDGRVPRFMTALIFYWLTPIALTAITWKALAYPQARLLTVFVTCLVTFVLVFLQIRRRPDRLRRRGTPTSCVILVMIILTVGLIFHSPHWFRRSFNLFQADLRGALLKGLDMSRVNASYSNLEGANLEGVNLERGDLISSNLQDAYLQSASLRWANLERANLQRANLNSANLHEAYLRYANLQGANLAGAYLQGTNFIEANLQAANLERATLARAITVDSADLRGANLEAANLQRVDMEGADLRDANLKDADLKWAILRDADLTNANVREAKNWRSAIYDAKMLQVLGLEPNHNDELVRMLESDELKKRLLKRDTDLSGPQIVDEKVRAQRPGDPSVSIYSAKRLARDQTAQVTIATFKGNNPCFAGVILRGTVSPVAYYAFVALKNHREGYTTQIYENVNGTYSVLAAEKSRPWQAGDVLRAASSGSLLTLYRNRQVVLTASDAAIQGGQAGIIIGCNSGDVANAELDDFLATDLLKGR